MKSLLNIIPALAFKDLVHEMVLTLCLVIAISSVIAPLLILLGLKNGTIYTLRKRLTNDPSFCEIRPVETRQYSAKWFRELKSDKRVGFLIPTILPASSTVYLRSEHKKRWILVDIVPTASGDPLLNAANIQAPKGDQCVISFGVANDFHIQNGQKIKVKVSRYKGGHYEYGEAFLEVVGILPKQYGTLPRIYAPLDFLLDIEAFKEGRAVTSRGWSGSIRRPFMRFNGIIVFSKTPLDPILQNSLLIEGGLANIRPVFENEVKKYIGILPNKKFHTYILSNPNMMVSPSSFRAVKNRLRGLGTIVLPFNKEIVLTINGKKVTAIGLSPDIRAKGELNLYVPWSGFSEKKSGKELLQILLPDGIDCFNGQNRREIIVKFNGLEQISFPLRVAGISKEKFAILPVELSSILTTALARRVIFDKKVKDFVLIQSGFRGFRLYAKDLDSVEPLYNKLKSQGIQVTAKIEAIERIKTLDSGLSRLFWLIAILGVTGAICVLAASIYASVERKRNQLAVLRLLGMSRGDLFFFPVFEAIFIATGSCIIAILAYKLVSEIINSIFRKEMRVGELICTLPESIIFWTVIITLMIAVLSSLIGALKTSNIDPAEALREE